MTRDEYLNQASSTAAHRAYYAQYVGEQVKLLVARVFGGELYKSKDPHLNDLELRRWDALKANGDYLTLGTGVCVLKEAARQLIESQSATAQP